jgi:hypothetical protein
MESSTLSRDERRLLASAAFAQRCQLVNTRAHCRTALGDAAPVLGKIADDVAILDSALQKLGITYPAPRA